MTISMETGKQTMAMASPCWKLSIGLKKIRLIGVVDMERSLEHGWENKRVSECVQYYASYVKVQHRRRVLYQDTIVYLCKSQKTVLKGTQQGDK